MTMKYTYCENFQIYGSVLYGQGKLLFSCTDKCIFTGTMKHDFHTFETQKGMDRNSLFFLSRGGTGLPEWWAKMSSFVKE